MSKKIFCVNDENAGSRLDIFLTKALSQVDITRSQVKKDIENELIKVNNKVVKAGYILSENDLVEYDFEEKKEMDFAPQDIKLDIIYEDEYLAIINKPQGMIVHPAGSVKSDTLVNALLFHFKKNLSNINGDFRPGIVHRLDKDTSGLLVIAKNDAVHLKLQKQIQEKVCHRIYRAVCYGKFTHDSGVIENFLARGTHQHEKIFVVPNGQGRLAITHYKVLSQNGKYSYVEYELKTGRTHQIRVHSAHIGHPIVGDKVYGRGDENLGLNGQLLHAYKLELIHPITNRELSFEAPLPHYFEKFLMDNKLK